MNRSSIACTALALALALYASDGRAQQRPPSPSTSPQTNPPPTTTPGTQKSPSTSSQPGGTITAESFVQEVAQDYQKEIEVSRLATTKAQSKDVKDYAKQLVDDHTKGLEKLRKYASEKSIALRTAAGTTTDRPASTSGAPAGRNEPAPGGHPGDKDSPQPGQTGHEPSTSRPSSSGTYGEGASAQMRELSAKSGAQFDKAYIQMMVDDHQKAVSLFERQHDAKLGDSELQSFISDQQGTLKKHLNKAKDIQKDLEKETDKDTSRTPAPGTKPLPSGAPAGAPTR
jgi:putative membrane protein